jgi:membrane fusion protein, multidrug efflux system
MKCHALWIVLALAVALAIAGACKKKEETAAPGGKRGGMRQASFPVEVQKVEAPPHDVVITAPGVVDAFERIQVTARVAGVVDKVMFVEGQEVKKGQILAVIDSRRYALSVSQARAAVGKSAATAADVEASLKRRESASSSNPGVISGEELETYKTKLRTAKADVDANQQALNIAQLNLSDSYVRALAEGAIQTRTVQTGQYVQAGTVIATLLQRDPMLLRFHATTGEAPRLKVGMPVKFMLKDSTQSYDANISLIAAAAETESRLVPITAEVVAPDKKFWLRPGSFAEVTISLQPQRLLPMIPQTAARPSDKGFLAYVLDGDIVHERVLQLGLHTAEGNVEVRDGLKVGDMVVTRGLEALAEGVKVRVSGPGGATSGSAGPRGSSAPGGSGSGRKRQRPPGASSAAPEAP